VRDDEDRLEDLIVRFVLVSTLPGSTAVYVANRDGVAVPGVAALHVRRGVVPLGEATVLGEMGYRVV